MSMAAPTALVTIEDLLEAVVGEIEDEHDTDDGPLIRKINSNIFIASARAELSDVQDLIGADFDPGEHADDVDTLGGLVFALAGHVPLKGEVIGGIKNFEFEVHAGRLPPAPPHQDQAAEAAQSRRPPRPDGRPA